MSDSTVRVRFAPSPTGFLHVGGARTALFNYLFARHHGGAFILRIEDTDRARSSAAMTDAILDGLGWLGLDWDEGPFFQADGLARHEFDARRLLDAGCAYRCFCGPGALEARRAAAGADPKETRYDRHCLEHVSAAESDRRATAGESFAVRFLVPEGVTAWTDAVYGAIEFANADIEDFVILRSDGTPIYNMAVVSDDVAMGITHVIRGDDHLSNTPKQILIYRALGAALPEFAHVPMILGEDGRRLSKRHGATAVGEYREQGILADAMANFLALLGWSPGTEEEIFTMAELVERFSLDAVNRKSAVFDPRKLWWLNGRHIAQRSTAELLDAVGPRMVRANLLSVDELEARGTWLLDLVELLKARARTLDDIVIQATPWLRDDFDYEADAVGKHWADRTATLARLEALSTALAELPEWNEAELEAAIRERAAALGLGAGKLIHPLRVALLGTAVSPGIFEVAALLGRERVLSRIERARRALADPPDGDAAHA
jgi:glutamyl-tRNA synthetase